MYDPDHNPLYLLLTMGRGDNIEQQVADYAKKLMGAKKRVQEKRNDYASEVGSHGELTNDAATAKVAGARVLDTFVKCASMVDEITVKAINIDSDTETMVKKHEAAIEKYKEAIAASKSAISDARDQAVEKRKALQDIAQPFIGFMVAGLPSVQQLTKYLDKTIAAEGAADGDPLTKFAKYVEEAHDYAVEVEKKSEEAFPGEEESEAASMGERDEDGQFADDQGNSAAEGQDGDQELADILDEEVKGEEDVDEELADEAKPPIRHRTSRKSPPKNQSGSYGGKDVAVLGRGLKREAGLNAEEFEAAVENEEFWEE